MAALENGHFSSRVPAKASAARSQRGSPLPTQCTCVCLRAGGLRRDAVEGWTRGDTDTGQTFYEGPDDVHVLDRNASSTQPAKFLVFFIKDKGAPVLVPAQ
ncbi:hypothetical protein AAFX91_28640 [Bradyrhizobium sp. 31Argb]|uniref:hypothetical protein n=1 Tax=Bradyrhizobium sp. 31Argb TaxID=3141247 RepID=UPI0037493805